MPVLPFLDGKEIRIGETVSAVAARLGRAAESGRQEVDRGSLGERLTRFYEYAGSRFILVFEPFERNGEVQGRGDLFAVELELQLDSIQAFSTRDSASATTPASRSRPAPRCPRSRRPSAARP